MARRGTLRAITDLLLDMKRDGVVKRSRWADCTRSEVWLEFGMTRVLTRMGQQDPRRSGS